MSYIWSNNGKNNKKVYSGQSIPKGYNKGYILRKKDLVKVLRKLDKKYQEKLKELDIEYTNKKKKLEQWLILEQKKITDF
jgi:hypothetical protein